MGHLAKFWGSSVGKKIVMGATGVILVAFVIAHMAGNLQVFLGAQKFNAYAMFLQHDVVEILWIVRFTLLACVVLHIVAAYQLTRRNWAARPEEYQRRETQVSTYASRSMRWGGIYLLLFIPYHILHLTTGTLHPAFSKTGAYGNVIVGFEALPVSLFYLGAMAILFLHLYHGAWAAFRTLGVARPSSDPLKRRLAFAVALVVSVGFSLVPLSVSLGLVH